MIENNLNKVENPDLENTRLIEKANKTIEKYVDDPEVRGLLVKNAEDAAEILDQVNNIDSIKKEISESKAYIALMQTLQFANYSLAVGAYLSMWNQAYEFFDKSEHPVLNVIGFIMFRVLGDKLHNLGNFIGKGVESSKHDKNLSKFEFKKVVADFKATLELKTAEPKT